MQNNQGNRKVAESTGQLEEAKIQKQASCSINKSQ
jgi:hypothetical protein